MVDTFNQALLGHLMGRDQQIDLLVIVIFINAQDHNYSVIYKIDLIANSLFPFVTFLSNRDERSVPLSLQCKLSVSLLLRFGPTEMSGLVPPSLPDQLSMCLLLKLVPPNLCNRPHRDYVMP